MFQKVLILLLPGKLQSLRDFQKLLYLYKLAPLVCRVVDQPQIHLHQEPLQSWSVKKKIDHGT